MSRKQLTTIACPRCGHTQEITVWHSLNATLDPQAKQELFDGRINLFHCAACDVRALLNVDFLYHDMERHFSIRYCPPESIQDDAVLSQFTTAGKLNLPELSDVKLSPALQEPQIVFDMHEVVRYIRFREALWTRRSITVQSPDTRN